MNIKKESLTKQIQNLETILNSVGSFIYAKDLAGCYTYVNQKVCDLFELTADEIIGKDDSHFFDLNISDELRQNDNKVMTQGITVEQEELIFVKSLGELRTCKSIKSPMYDDEGNIIGMYGLSTELSETDKLKEQLKQQKKLLDVVLDNVDAHIYIKDAERRFLYVNHKVAEVFGLPVEKVIGQLDSDVIPFDLADHFWESDKIVLKSQKKQTINETLTDQNGKQFHYISTKIPYRMEDDKDVLIGFSTDVTELYELKERFQTQASTDALTGLYNRRYFLESAEREFHRAKRHKSPFSIINIDIDRFKRVNDTYGHPVGDQVLIAVTKNILPIIRAEDIFARIGGEEFSILLPNTSPEKARFVAHRICQMQADTPITGDWVGEINATISVGVTCMKTSDSCFQELFSRSDKALYRAKDTGKNRVTFLE